jgi:hypothetical protein
MFFVIFAAIFSNTVKGNLVGAAFRASVEFQQRISI